MTEKKAKKEKKSGKDSKVESSDKNKAKDAKGVKDKKVKAGKENKASNTSKVNTASSVGKKLEAGSISVHTENLFPIIKKWLYSEHDIYLRELISNAHDAIKKLDRLADLGEYKGKLDEPLISVSIDKDNKTLTISDNGLGMTQDEIKKYINQIAFSGAEDFLKKYEQGKKAEETGIIGHFGLGFFSSFMVSDKVEIDTLSYHKNAQAVRWSCEGSTSFEISESSRTEVGTDIILHINEDNKEYLEESKVKELVKRYSNFLPVEIQINGNQENEKLALWQKKTKDVTQDEYKEFYQKLFPGEAEPLFHVHLDVDYPFHLKGILYFPKIRNDLEVHMKGRIKLFCNNVFVSDNIPDIIPQYLNLLQGVLDSPDIPLNVSRSFLQVDENVKKIVSHIIKKLVDRLKEIKKEDPKKYQEYWEDIQPFVKFGMMNDQDFYDKAQEILIFKKTNDDYVTVDEYKKENEKLKNKILYASNMDNQAHHVKKLEEEGVSVLLLDSPIDPHFIQQMEMRWMPTRFLRVDSDIPENLLKNEEVEKVEDDKEKTKHEDFFKHLKAVLGNESLEFKLNAFKETDIPALLTINEHMRRFSDMSSMMNRGGSSSNIEFATLVLNSNNEIVKKVEELYKSDRDGDQFKELSTYLFQVALIQQQKLKGEDLNEFIRKVTKMMESKLK